MAPVRLYFIYELGKHIVKAGWDNWRNPKNEKTARYAEYKNTGEGADISQRVSWARQLSDKDVKMLVKSEFYTFSNTWDLY